MDNNFSSAKVNNYIKKRKEICSKNGDNLDSLNFNQFAVMSLFDKNTDGKISKKEFDNISRNVFDKFLSGLNTYNAKNGFEKAEFQYDSFVEYIDDGMIFSQELTGEYKNFGFKGKNFPENKHLKDINQMSMEEKNKELQSYGITEGYKTDNKFQVESTLHNARKQIAVYDMNSDIVDGHIGTYIQAENNLCSFLSVLDTMSDSEIKKLYQVKKDVQGENYYEVRFPIDGNAPDKTVVVTQYEVDCACTTIANEKGENEDIDGLSRGDKDVAMLQVAYLKRFGSDPFYHGAWLYEVKNIFRTPDEAEYVRTNNYETLDFKNLPKNSIICLIEPEARIEKGLEGKDYTLSDGRKVIYYMNGRILKLSDGTIIRRNHAYSVRGYDEKNKELIISGNEHHNLSELRVPTELAKFFETASPKSDK